MDISVLGPLEIRIDGNFIVPSAGKPRQLLALLALRAGRIVQVPTLMEEAWGARIPRSAQTTLQTYVLQLRRRIAAALPAGAPQTAKEVLATRLGGYQLTGAVHESDLRTFQRLTAEGSAALDAGDARRASDALGRALRLWRGPALADVPVGPVLETEVLGMDEARTRTVELRVEADLQLGRHAEILGELRMLTARHPLHENFSAQLMIAYYRSGHTWRALETYQRLRGALVGELGVEPSRRVQRLHQLVLGGSSGPLRSDLPELPEFALEVSR
ncbi:BTAD domain-containing putative transcriptional regulator [Kitasatospora sp. NPDC057692]|uniref:AfsR/SARP family transcriptional regulator n=1 Tax=Kitasatospora sp. NPDC057692 TaxID=3346215 RepID=UPI0036A3FA1F